MHIYIPSHTHTIFPFPATKFIIMGSRTELSTSSCGVKMSDLSPSIQKFINEHAKVCQPDKIHICDGSEEENRAIIQLLLEDGRLVRLSKYDNW